MKIKKLTSLLLTAALTAGTLTGLTALPTLASEAPFDPDDPEIIKVRFLDAGSTLTESQRIVDAINAVRNFFMSIPKASALYSWALLKTFFSR